MGCARADRPKGWGVGAGAPEQGPVAWAEQGVTPLGVTRDISQRPTGGVTLPWLTHLRKPRPQEKGWGGIFSFGAWTLVPG